MKCCIVEAGNPILPKYISEAIELGNDLLVYYDKQTNKVLDTYQDTPRELHSLIQDKGMTHTNVPDKLIFNNMGGKEKTMKNQNSNPIASLIKGDLDGLKNFNLGDLFNHIKGSIKRTGVAGLSASKVSARLNVGEIVLKRLSKIFVETFNESVPSFGVWKLKKKAFDLTKHEESVGLFIGITFVFGSDLLTYFGLPLTKANLLLANCCMEYAVHKMQLKLRTFIPGFNKFNEVGDIFKQSESKLGKSKIEDLANEDENKAKDPSDLDDLKNV